MYTAVFTGWLNGIAHCVKQEMSHSSFVAAAVAETYTLILTLTLTLILTLTLTLTLTQSCVRTNASQAGFRCEGGEVKQVIGSKCRESAMLRAAQQELIGMRVERTTFMALAATLASIVDIFLRKSPPFTHLVLHEALDDVEARLGDQVAQPPPVAGLQPSPVLRAQRQVLLRRRRRAQRPDAGNLAGQRPEGLQLHMQLRWTKTRQPSCSSSMSYRQIRCLAFAVGALPWMSRFTNSTTAVCMATDRWRRVGTATDCRRRVLCKPTMTPASKAHVASTAARISTCPRQPHLDAGDLELAGDVGDRSAQIGPLPDRHRGLVLPPPPRALRCLAGVQQRRPLHRTPTVVAAMREPGPNVGDGRVL